MRAVLNWIARVPDAALALLADALTYGQRCAPSPTKARAWPRYWRHSDSIWRALLA